MSRFTVLASEKPPKETSESSARSETREIVLGVAEVVYFVYNGLFL